MFSTHQKGELAQLKVEQTALEKGWISARPNLETRFDVILYDSIKFYRAQVKYASTEIDGVVRVDLRSECRNNGHIKKYTADEIDVVLAYLPEVDVVLWIDAELFDNKACLSFRTKPAKNNQVKGIRKYEDFIWGCS